MAITRKTLQKESRAGMSCLRIAVIDQSLVRLLTLQDSSYVSPSLFGIVICMNPQHLVVLILELASPRLALIHHARPHNNSQQ